ncbi:competence type IV pilus minor pilin ComGF [Ureibacillus aquaedulcis]|uniref:Competence type IV pilus minor pilin ComGF n=1 Tax=Ureibacillus aquaedulcis TaxID=3058421 RepID=A0ABT8GPH5_9BACL|nr:competence type IV pilus minor pilin ComGF [Ureibacillus sp. BA0131]MDN4493317.1 competence type IV pilus minor pilin ComGF [Ureibacillus sp. BA0131]
MHQSKWRIIHNSQGYTLLEALFSLVVFVLLSQILLLVMFWIKQMDTTFFTEEHLQWELFVQDFQDSFSNVKEVRVSNQSNTLEVFYMKPDESIKIDRSGDVLRLTINHEGNIPWLIGIESALFSWDGQFIKISVIFQNGIEKERRFFVQTNTE